MIAAAEKRDAIYRDCYPKVSRYIAARVHNPQEAEDLVSEVFLKVYQKLESFDETKSSVSTWVYAITKNTVIDYYRTNRFHSELAETLPAADDLEGDLCHEDTLNTLAAALSSLDERQRDIIILRYYRGLSLKEIAQRMALSYSYIKLLHTSALGTLKKRLT